MPLLASDANSWIWWSWVGDNRAVIQDALWRHVQLTAMAVGIGLLIALPLGLLAHRYRWVYPPLLGFTNILYTIPSLALLVVLIPVTGLSTTTALVPLVLYTLAILIRNIVTGLDGVPDDVREAAIGTGMSNARRVLRVDLPLALPAIVAGVRIATVTTIGLVTVTAVIGEGGLGQLMRDGFQRQFRTPLVIGVILVVLLGLAADLTLVALERVFTPWRRAR